MSKKNRVSKKDTERALASLSMQGAQDQAHKRLNTPVLWGEVPKLLSRVGEAHFRAVAGVATGLTRTDLSVAAIVDLLVEKGVFTHDEFNEREAEMTRRFTETRSPMQEQAESLAEGQTVERLVEVPVALPVEEETLDRTRTSVING